MFRLQQNSYQMILRFEKHKCLEAKSSRVWVRHSFDNWHNLIKHDLTFLWNTSFRFFPQKMVLVIDSNANMWCGLYIICIMSILNISVSSPAIYSSPWYISSVKKVVATRKGLLLDCSWSYNFTKKFLQEFFPNLKSCLAVIHIHKQAGTGSWFYRL